MLARFTAHNAWHALSRATGFNDTVAQFSAKNLVREDGAFDSHVTLLACLLRRSFNQHVDFSPGARAKKEYTAATLSVGQLAQGSTSLGIALDCKWPLINKPIAVSSSTRNAPCTTHNCSYKI